MTIVTKISSTLSKKIVKSISIRLLCKITSNFSLFTISFYLPIHDDILVDSFYPTTLLFSAYDVMERSTYGNLVVFSVLVHSLH